MELIPVQGIWSLRNHYGDAEDNVKKKLSYIFTYECRDTHLSITVKTTAKLNPEQSDKFETKI